MSPVSFFRTVYFFISHYIMKCILLKVLKILIAWNCTNSCWNSLNSQTLCPPLLSLPLSTVADLKGAYAGSFVFYTVTFQWMCVDFIGLGNSLGEEILCSNGEEVIYDQDGPESLDCHLGNMCWSCNSIKEYLVWGK